MKRFSRLILLTICFAAASFLLGDLKAQAATLVVGPGQAYTSIQAAINAASTGDTITVKNGVYSEHVNVNKPGLTIVGEDRDLTVIDGGGSGYVATISNNNTTFKNITLRNGGPSGIGGAGLYITAANFNTIDNCRATGNAAGIFLYNGASNNTVQNCIAADNFEIGINVGDFRGQRNNRVLNNKVYNNVKFGICGAVTTDGTVCIGNEASGHEYGIAAEWTTWIIENNIVSNSKTGILLFHGMNCIARNNTVSATERGIWLCYSSTYGNLVENNDVQAIGSSIGEAISLENAARNNIIRNNKVHGSLVGMNMLGSANKVYGNTLVDNVLQARDNGSGNLWYENGRGNGWSDYTGIDANGDGIGDIPYNIPGTSESKDLYPIMLSLPLPAASPAPGSFEGSVSVVLSSPTAGAAIYYTTDGSDPTSSSPLYSGPVLLNASATIKAIAVKGNIKSSAASFAYTITIPNRPPVMETIGDKTVDEGQTLSFIVAASDPEGDSLTYSAEGLPAGAAFNSSTGSFTWTPGYDQSGSYQATFRVSDGALSDSKSVSITVNNVNRAPVIEAIGDKTVDEGQLLTFAIAATDPDGDSLTISATGLPAGASFDPTSKIFSWTPGYNQAGSYQVSFKLSDGTLEAASSATINVNDVSPISLLEKLIQDIRAIGLPKGAENSLVTKCENTIKSLQKNNNGPAANALNALINEFEAKRGKDLTAEQADQLITEARFIISII